MQQSAVALGCGGGNGCRGEIVGVVNRVAPVEDANAFDIAADAEIELVLVSFYGETRCGGFVEAFGRVLYEGVIDFLVRLARIENNLNVSFVGYGGMVLRLERACGYGAGAYCNDDAFFHCY